MVKTRSAGPAASLRRSARLSGTGSIGQDDFLRLLQENTQQRPSRKRKRRNADDDDSEDVVEEVHSASGATNTNTKTERSLSPGDLKCQERTLKQRITELKRRQSDLDSQVQNLETIMREREREKMLEFLDENLQCALCCEIIACPYAPTAATCGHSFCALCLLKWFFSRLHRACGSWHENVACPFCRAQLPYTPTYPPRDLSCFPFAPNRLAETCIRAAVEKLTNVAGLDSSVNKRENGSRRNSRVKKEESVGLSAESDVDEWLEGGKSRIDWMNRERRGHDEMEDIRTRWAELTPEDFAAIKIRLNV